MQFADILEKARAMAAETDISQVDFMAVQVNIIGEGSGVFYVEVKNGRISVEPYEYYDRQCAVTLSADTFFQVTSGALDPCKAYDEGSLRAEGDLGRALQFTDLMKAGVR